MKKLYDFDTGPLDLMLVDNDGGAYDVDDTTNGINFF